MLTLVNGKREVVTGYVNAGDMIGWAAVTGETTMLPTMREWFRQQAPQGPLRVSRHLRRRRHVCRRPTAIRHRSRHPTGILRCRDRRRNPAVPTNVVRGPQCLKQLQQFFSFSASVSLPAISSTLCDRESNSLFGLLQRGTRGPSNTFRNCPDDGRRTFSSIEQHMIALGKTASLPCVQNLRNSSPRVCFG